MPAVRHALIFPVLVHFHQPPTLSSHADSPSQPPETLALYPALAMVIFPRSPSRPHSFLLHRQLPAPLRRPRRHHILIHDQKRHLFFSSAVPMLQKQRTLAAITRMRTPEASPSPPTPLKAPWPALPPPAPARDRCQSLPTLALPFFKSHSRFAVVHLLENALRFLAAIPFCVDDLESASTVRPTVVV